MPTFGTFIRNRRVSITFTVLTTFTTFATFALSIRTTMTLHAVVEIAYAFAGVLAFDVFYRMFVAAVAGVLLVVVGGVTSGACGVVVAV